MASNKIFSELLELVENPKLERSAGEGIEYFKNVGKKGEETQGAIGTALRPVLRRARQPHELHDALIDATRKAAQNPQSDETNGEKAVQEKLKQQARETAKKDAEDHIPTTTYSGKTINGKEAANKVKKVLKNIRKNDSYDKFKKMLKNQGVIVDLQYDGRLKRLYEAYKKAGLFG